MFVCLSRNFVFCHFSNKGGEQDIQLTNDKRVVSHYNDPKSAGKAADPGTCFENNRYLLQVPKKTIYTMEINLVI